MKHVISDGIGVQSWTMKHLAKRGLITPMPVEAVFADPRDERKVVYSYLESQRDKFPFPIKVISKMKLSEQALRVRVSKTTGLTYLKHLIPTFVVRSSGKHGMMGRACTVDSKIEPIRQYLRRELIGRQDYLAWRRKHKVALKELALSREEKRPCDFAAWKSMQDDALVCLWIGISTDEIDRCKDSVVPWIVNRHPLCELGKTRTDCLAWLDSEGEPEPPDSSCKQCPYHSDDKWIRMKNEAPEEFSETVQFERDYQAAFKQCPRLDGVPYLHEARIPLDQVVFVPGKKRSVEQLPCKGICGV